VVHRFFTVLKKKKKKQNLKKLKKIFLEWNFLKFLKKFLEKARLFLSCEARLKLGRKKWRENYMQKLNYAQGFLCEGWYENCNNYEIYIYNNYEKLRSFREESFFYFSWRVFF